MLGLFWWEDTKTFKTYRQQLSILRVRGLEAPTDGKAKQALERKYS